MQDNGWDIYDPAAEQRERQTVEWETYRPETERQEAAEPVVAEEAVTELSKQPEQESAAVWETDGDVSESAGDGNQSGPSAEKGKEEAAEFLGGEPETTQAVPEKNVEAKEDSDEPTLIKEVPQEPAEEALEMETPVDGAVAEEAPEEPAAMNPEIKEQLEQLNLRLEQLDRKFNEKIKTSESQDVMAKTLYAEVQEYKKGMYSEILKPLLLELVQMRNNIVRQCRSIVEKEGSDARISVQRLLDYGEDIRDVLEAYDVEIYNSEPGSEFDPKSQKLLKKVPVTREMMNKKVAVSLCDGYRYKDRTIMKENVKVYVYEPETEEKKEV